MATLLFSGCASIKYGDKEAETEMKKFVPIPGKTSLYVCRENAVFVAVGVRTTVLVDNEEIGTVKPNTFVHTALEPGKHAVHMKNDGIAAIYSPVITLETKADETAFLWIGVTGGGLGTYTVDFFENKQSGMDCVTGAAYSVRSN